MVFVDNSNIFLGAKDLGCKIDYQKLANFLSVKALEQYDLMRVFLYCTINREQTPDRVKFQVDLYKHFNSFIKFDVATFDLRIIRDKETGNIIDKYEKGVDVALVTDLLLQTKNNAFDVAIICAGDNDFFRAVEGVKDAGREIYVASFDHSCSDNLKGCSLGYISLTKNLEKIRI
jgi:uncharacterized LabA/DUF88 family protein